jgi:hypothetical protein
MSDFDSPASGSPTDPFTAALALLAAVADPKGAQARLRELRGVLADVEAAQKQLSTDRSNCEAELAAARSACAEELAAKRAEVERSEKTYAKLHADLEAEKRRFADRLDYAKRLEARYESYWRIRINRELGAGAATLINIPSVFADAPEEPEDAHYRAVAEGGFNSSVDTSEITRTGTTGDPFPPGVSLTRSRPTMRRGAEV